MYRLLLNRHRFHCRRRRRSCVGVESRAAGHRKVERLFVQSAFGVRCVSCVVGCFCVDVTVPLASDARALVQCGVVQNFCGIQFARSHNRGGCRKVNDALTALPKPTTLR